MMANNMGKMPQLLKENEGTYQDLSFGPEAPARLYYSIVRKGEKKSQLEVYDIESKCTLTPQHIDGMLFFIHQAIIRL